MLTSRWPRHRHRYFHSSATLNYARSLIKEGFCDLRCSTNWELGFVKSPLHRGKYEKMVSTILDSLAFADICGLADESRLKTIDLFTCHEGLHLPYEEVRVVNSRVQLRPNGGVNSISPAHLHVLRAHMGVRRTCR